ncbi:MAG TPA: hypothetical protein VGM96_25710 [Reyranella sp.]|jgi:hypothetical protein
MGKDAKDLAVLSASDSHAKRNQVLEGLYRRVWAAGAAKVRQPVQSDSVDVAACRCVVQHLRDVFDQEPVLEGPLDEAETVDMLGLEGKAIRATALASGRL